MRSLILASALFAATVVAIPSAQAQSGSGSGGGAAAGGRAQERRAEVREKLKNMSPEDRKAALDKAKAQRDERMEKLSPEQKAWVEARSAETKRIREAVKAGTITKESAAQQLKAWRDANPRPKAGGSGD